jgi:hypothetical protein
VGGGLATEDGFGFFQGNFHGILSDA